MYHVITLINVKRLLKSIFMTNFIFHPVIIFNKFFYLIFFKVQ